MIVALPDVNFTERNVDPGPACNVTGSSVLVPVDYHAVFVSVGVVRLLVRPQSERQLLTIPRHPLSFRFFIVAVDNSRVLIDFKIE